MASIEIEKQKAIAVAQAQRLAAQKGGQHYSFDGSNVPGYDPKTGAVVGGSLDNHLMQNLGAGIREAGEGILGSMGDLGNLASQGVSKVAEYFGASPETQQGIQNSTNNLVTSQDVRDNVTDPILGQSDPAIGPTEQLFRTGGNFAAGALAPGGLVRKGLNVALPMVGSEAGARVADGLGVDESYGRAAGGILGGGAAMLEHGGNPVKAAAKGAPTKEFVKKGTNDLYTALGEAGIKYDSNAYSQAAQGIMDTLLKEQFRPGQSPGVGAAFSFVDDLVKNAGQSPDFAAVDAMAKRAGEEMRAAYSNPATQPAGKAWEKVLDGIHEFEQNAPFIANEGVSAETVNKSRSMARNLALKNIKQRELDRIVKNADTYQSGKDAGLRNGIGNLLRSKRGQNMFSDEERTALLQVAQGHKTLRSLSRFGFDVFPDSGNASLVPVIGNLGAAALAGGAGAGGGAAAAIGAGTALVGTAAKYIAPKLTEKGFNTASDAIRSGKLSSAEGRMKTQQLMDDMKRRRRITAASTAGGTNAGSQK